MSYTDLVIRLPEEVYKNIQSKSTEIQTEGYTIENAILNGTPLPKGHGRIADMDEAIKCLEEVQGEDAIWAIGLIEWACGKRTILEADIESEDKDENM